MRLAAYWNGNIAAAVANFKVSTTLAEAIGPSEGRLWEYTGVNSCLYCIFGATNHFLPADAKIACNMWSLDFRFAHPSMQHLGKAGCGKPSSLPTSCPLNTACSLILPYPFMIASWNLKHPKAWNSYFLHSRKLRAGSVRNRSTMI